EPHVPQSVNAHAFLPNTLRTRLGIEDNDRRYSRDAYQLTAMVHARTHLHLIAGRRPVLGDPVRPSRLHLAVTREALARRLVRFLAPADRPAREPDHDDVPVVRDARDTSAFRLPPEPEIVLAETPTVLNVTDFGRLLTDPYAFALARVLGEEREDDS